MKPGVKAFGLSLMAHAALAGMVMMTAGRHVSPPGIVYIDFFMENSLSGSGDSVKAGSGHGDSGGGSGRLQEPSGNAAGSHEIFHQKAVQKTVNVHPAVRKISSGKSAYSARKKRDESTSVSGSKLAMVAGKTGSGVSASVDSTAEGSVGEGPGMAVETSGGGMQGAADRYMLEHYLYIRDLVRKNLKYPRVAINLGLSGKVGVSFTVLENGEVTDLEVVGSSGARILDIDAVETIQRSAPFPAPPALARIVIPVEYILE